MTRETEEILRAENLVVSFGGQRRWWRSSARIAAVNQVNLTLRRGETYGLVGESGSGKSTLARCLMRLIDVETGTIWLKGVDITTAGGRDLRRRRRLMQLVFQDPYSSLDPSSTIGNIVAEPLRVHENLDRGERRERVRLLLEQVGLPPDAAERFPFEFSGGQRQRVAIARAIATQPELVVLDEAVSALDVSTQAQILELLEQLRADHDLTYLFISHNLAVVRSVAAHVGVMLRGRIVEEGPADRVFSRPAHPYTRALLDAVPIPDPTARRPVATSRSENGHVPDDLTGDGCPYIARCPHAWSDCVAAPEQSPVDGGGWAACHLLVDHVAIGRPSAQPSLREGGKPLSERQV